PAPAGRTTRTPDAVGGGCRPTRRRWCRPRPRGCRSRAIRACSQPTAPASRPLLSTGRGAGSEQPGGAGLDALHVLVVQHDAADAAILGQYTRLRLDLLCGEDAGDGGEVRIATQQLQVAGQLLHAVDVASALDLHGDGRATGIPDHQVDRADGRRVLAAHQGAALADQVDLLGQQPLQIGLHAVLLQARVDAEIVTGVVDDLVD